MPYKLRNSRRHKFKKARYKINNWSDYNEALKLRGSVTLWLSDEVIKSWYARKVNGKQGSQYKYSDLAIQAALTIKTVYSLPYRATQGFLISIMQLMNITIDVPDYTRLCRRANTIEISDLKTLNNDEDIHIVIDSTGLKIFGAGLWHEEKHGLNKRREWRKLHLVIDRDTHEIIAQELTASNVSDDAPVAELLNKTPKNIMSIAADQAYDTDVVYSVIQKVSNADVTIAIPPRKDAALSTYYETDPIKRDHNILFVEEYGKYRWQDYSDYNYRSLVETAMFRYKTLIGEKMYSRDFAKQKVEIKIACLVLNKMTRIGMPKSSKIKEAA